MKNKIKRWWISPITNGSVVKNIIINTIVGLGLYGLFIHWLKAWEKSFYKENSKSKEEKVNKEEDWEL